MFANQWIDKVILTTSDIQTSKYHKCAGVHDIIWNAQ